MGRWVTAITALEALGKVGIVEMVYRSSIEMLMALDICESVAQEAAIEDAVPRRLLRTNLQKLQKI